MKYLLLCVTLISYVMISTFTHAEQINSLHLQKKLTTLEKELHGKIGVYALNTNNNNIIAYHDEKRFPVQSTSKLLVVAALLNKSSKNINVLQEKIHYTKNDLISWHPITGKYITQGMTLEALSEAAMSYSDNLAMNLIMKKLGGPRCVTNFANAIGNSSFNLEHYEGELNSNPKDKRDTATPKDMAISLQKLTLGNILAPTQRERLVTWMKNNTTSYTRMRAGAPLAWSVADKTGSGDYGVANDIGIMWSPVCKPIVVAIYTVQNKQNAKRRDDIVASITSLLLEEFGRNDDCFNKLK